MFSSRDTTCLRYGLITGNACQRTIGLIWMPQQSHQQSFEADGGDQIWELLCSIGIDLRVQQPTSTVRKGAAATSAPKLC